jgi:hypothetical protein
MRYSTWMWTAVILIVLLFGLGALGLYLTSSRQTQVDMRVEIFTILLQLGGIGILGFFVQRGVEQTFETAGVRAQLRKELLARLLDTYRSAKLARRTLRAAGLSSINDNPPSDLSPDHLQEYKRQMDVINEAQVDLEWFPKEYSPIIEAGSEIERSLDVMEKYLAQLNKEWEEQGTKSSVKFDELKRLEEFTRKRGDKRARPDGWSQEDFFQARRRVVEQLVKRQPSSLEQLVTAATAKLRYANEFPRRMWKLHASRSSGS